MKSKILATLLVITFGLSLSAQEKENTYNKFRIGIGTEVMTYMGYPISTYGYKAEVQIPIYQRLSSNISYVEQGSYFDYCDEVPVSITEKHLVYGLNYAFYNSIKWSFGSMLALDTEFTRYKERESLPENASVLHKEDAHQEDHSFRESYTEVLLGLEVNYSLTNRLMLNASSRLNSYGSFRNSVSVFYLFSLSKTNN